MNGYFISKCCVEQSIEEENKKNLVPGYDYNIVLKTLFSQQNVSYVEKSIRNFVFKRTRRVLAPIKNEIILDKLSLMYIEFYRDFNKMDLQSLINALNRITIKKCAVNIILNMTAHKLYTRDVFIGSTHLLNNPEYINSKGEKHPQGGDYLGLLT